jgi:hypothetical protein
MKTTIVYDKSAFEYIYKKNWLKFHDDDDGCGNVDGDVDADNDNLPLKWGLTSAIFFNHSLHAPHGCKIDDNKYHHHHLHHHQ